MMTTLLVLSIVDTAAAIVCVALLILRKAPAPPLPPDPAAIARAIMNTPFNIAEVTDAIDELHPPVPSRRHRVHYVVQHTHAGTTKILYEGGDSDKAYEAHLEMERHPDRYPGRHQYLENGRPRVDRLHSEIEH